MTQLIGIIDSTIDSTEQDPSFTFQTAGFYSVRQRAVNVVSGDEEVKLRHICAAAPPPQIQILAFRPWDIFWQATQGPNLYDLVRGDLEPLRAGTGDFSQSNLTCVLQNGMDNYAVDPEVPVSGMAFFYLAQGLNCLGDVDTYETGSASQIALRDSVLQGSDNPCSCDPTDADVDGDSVCMPFDNCPDLANPEQNDPDSDGIGSICDNCPDAPNPIQRDSDGDGLGDRCDNCGLVPNPDQADNDMDGLGDACDPLP